MNFEEDIFRKRVILFDKLEPFGFKKIDNKYVYTENILDNSMEVQVEVLEDGKVLGQVYDLSFGEIYPNYRIEREQGYFVSEVRKEFINILTNICHKCTEAKYFASNQACRLANLIKEKYGDNPDFPWEKTPDSGIFRNLDNEKWYALFMNINKNKLDGEDREVDILNIKLEPKHLKELLLQKGFYKAYHMNKENWITIILDDAVNDEVIMNLIDESHYFTEEAREFLIPSNPKYYDVINCFNDTNIISWKQPNHIKVHDIVYLYVGSPYSEIRYKCIVEKINIPYEYHDNNLHMSKVMRIKLLKRYDNKEYSLDKLRNYGITTVRGPRTVPKSLSKELNK